jgi:hypothetical protein
MKTQQPNPEVISAAMYEIIDNQLRDGEPPETKQTFDRLLVEGHSVAEARRLLATVAASEVFEVLKRRRPYDHASYVAALQRLPKLPWER